MLFVLSLLISEPLLKQIGFSPTTLVLEYITNFYKVQLDELLEGIPGPKPGAGNLTRHAKIKPWQASGGGGSCKTFFLF